MEACLAVPSWLWTRGGQDRAVARAAFRGLLPDAILSRRSKGRLESMFMKGYMSGRYRLENLLLDGRLAAAGLIDRAAILDYLRRPDQPGDSGYIRLLELSSAETWLRSFTG
jgi:asparagine synthase (glutamine-hydrolysing)